MTLTLKLSPELEASLTTQARASGMSLEQYITTLVERASVPWPAVELSPGERAAAFMAWAASHPATPPLSDFAVSRESIYRDSDR